MLSFVVVHADGFLEAVLTFVVALPVADVWQVHPRCFCAAVPHIPVLWMLLRWDYAIHAHRGYLMSFQMLSHCCRT